MNFQKILEEFLTALLTGILGVLCVFLIALVKKGLNWLSAKIGLIKDEAIRNNLNALNKFLEDTVFNVVTSLQQTLGDEIRESIKNNDGKYTREDLLKLKEKAFNQIMNQISEKDLAYLNEVYADLVGHINDLIEVNVHNLKFNSSLLTAAVLPDVLETSN